MPVVVVSVIASGALVRPTRVTPSVLELRARYGIEGGPRLRGDLFVVPFAPSMRQAASADWADGPETLWMRPASSGAPSSTATSAPDGSILVTLGTEFNTESGDLFDRILLALADIDAPVIVAVGRDLDPARFGPQPQRIRVERFVDLGALVPRTSVVLHHGGSGLFTACVLGGAPQIVFPMGADQPFTAEQVAALGLGLAMDAISSTAEQIRSAIVRVRADAAMRASAAALCNELLALPGPESLLPRIASLVPIH